MKRRRLVVLTIGISIGILLSGCGPKTKLGVVTQWEVTEFNHLGAVVPMRGIRVSGLLVSNPDNSPGTRDGYYGNTSEQDGTLLLPDAIVPAYWDHQVQEPLWCANAVAPPIQDWGVVDGHHIYAMVNFLTPNNWWLEWTCNVPPGTVPPASSRFAMAGSLPSSITLNGIDPFSTVYGMPVLDVYNGTNGNANHVTTITASSVDSNGASATFSLPSNLAASAYGFTTANADSNGGYTPNSLNLYSIASSQTIQGNPFGVAAQAISSFGIAPITTIHITTELARASGYSTPAQTTIHFRL